VLLSADREATHNMICIRLLIIALIVGWSWCALAADVAIDIGHSRFRPGALSARGVPEFQFNLALGQVIDQELRNASFKTLLIGANGDMEKLITRTELAAGASFLLSIHHDSVQPKYLNHWVHEGIRWPYSDRFKGFSLFVSRKNTQLTTSLHCASAIGEQLRGQGFVPSLYHAEPIPGENRPFADQLNGVHYFDDLVILKTAQSPAVLLEAGVIVNRDDEITLIQPETQAKIASAVSTALTACLRPTPAQQGRNATVSPSQEVLPGWGIDE
jgi:N-acetylmuramoyl-L-alanine amidase